MTSPIRPPRRLFADCSPKTQRIASVILLFPLPFGPTTAVMPGTKSIATLSANDLNPFISSRFNSKLLLSFRSYLCIICRTANSAAFCSACFFVRPVPFPRTCPFTTTCASNARLCAGPLSPKMSYWINTSRSR